MFSIYGLYCLYSGVKFFFKCLSMSWKRVRVIIRIFFRSRFERFGVNGELFFEVFVKGRKVYDFIISIFLLLENYNVYRW